MHFENDTFSFLLYFEKVPSAISEECNLNRYPKRFECRTGSEILQHCLRATHVGPTLFTHWSQHVLLMTCPCPLLCDAVLFRVKLYEPGCVQWLFVLTLMGNSDWNNQIHIKTSRWRRLIKVISYEVKWKCPTPLRKVYPSLTLTTWLAQIKTPSDESMKIHSPIHTS